ncbi:MAG TPA: hypothetical protein PK629_01110 [Oscillospiraceae bacterium]|nr:hypothetical protein [Oscillospiraceae bacterium]HPK35623.1 hypothetical protein [Oscillospiraceae bacterium]
MNEFVWQECLLRDILDGLMNPEGIRLERMPLTMHSLCCMDGSFGKNISDEIFLSVA